MTSLPLRERLARADEDTITIPAALVRDVEYFLGRMNDDVIGPDGRLLDCNVLATRLRHYLDRSQGIPRRDAEGTT